MMFDNGGFFCFFFTFRGGKRFLFNYPLVTMIPISESAESKLTVDAAARFDTVMAELFLSSSLFFFLSKIERLLYILSPSWPNR